MNAARSRAEQRVQRFLDAAFELIDEKGSTDFTIQQVIDRSKQSLRGRECESVWKTPPQGHHKAM